MANTSIAGVDGNQFIDPIKTVNSLETLHTQGQQEQRGQDASLFQNVFQSAWDNVTDTRADYEKQQYLLSVGEMDDPHNLVIAMNKAEMSVDLMVQLRNKALEAYDTLMRTSL